MSREKILFVIFYLCALGISAQQKGPVKPPAAFKYIDTSDIVISGQILDFHSNLPVRKLEIEVKGTPFNCITDKYGRFKFQLPDSLKGKEITVTTGYAAADFLDSTSSIVSKEKLVIDSLPFKKRLTLYRYPVERIGIVVTAGRPIRDYVGNYWLHPEPPIIPDTSIKAIQNNIFLYNLKIKK